MNRAQVILLIILVFSISSCFIADDLYGEKKKPRLSLKQKTQIAISSYIKENINNESYYKYVFSDLIIHKPKELILLDNLKKDRDNDNLDKDTLELKITKLEADIDAGGLSYSLEMDHVFSLTGEEKIDLLETRFFLNDKLEVSELRPLIELKLDEKQEDIFASYFFERVIFQTEDYYQSKKMSKSFYDHFKKHQQEIVGVKAKSDFMSHVLMLCNEVKGSGYFNQGLTLQKITKKQLKLKYEKMELESLNFSTLFEINENETLKGYYFFHKFSDSKSDLPDTNVVYVGFSPYYELVDLVEVERPFNQYFNE
jgi:hypothetical protein